VSRALDGQSKLPLMGGAHTADSARQDLAALRDEVPQELAVFEIDVSDLFGAELADPLAPNRKPLWCWHGIPNLSLTILKCQGTAGRALPLSNLIKSQNL
jgi:hypothetical protein